MTIRYLNGHGKTDLVYPSYNSIFFCKWVSYRISTRTNALSLHRMYEEIVHYLYVQCPILSVRQSVDTYALSLSLPIWAEIQFYSTAFQMARFCDLWFVRKIFGTTPSNNKARETIFNAKQVSSLIAVLSHRSVNYKTEKHKIITCGAACSRRQLNTTQSTQTGAHYSLVYNLSCVKEGPGGCCFHCWDARWADKGAHYLSPRGTLGWRLRQFIYQVTCV